MYLQTLIVFALVFFRSDQLRGDASAGAREWAWAFAAVAALLLGTALLTRIATKAALRRMGGVGGDLHDAHHLHHRWMTTIKASLLIGFGIVLYATPWPIACYGLTRSPWLRIASDVLLLVPYFVCAAALWAFSHPVERAFRAEMGEPRTRPSDPAHGFSRWGFVLFNFRFHILVVALPMLLILFTANLARGYGAWIRRNVAPWPFAPDLLLGAVAFLVFLVSPLLLTRVWSTTQLERGPLRDRLEAVCRAIGLRCRDVLLWKSDGMMINAAVMGLVAPVRYVLLSDGLLQSMNDRQIEAVFGHEAGHIRRRHIEFFLLFAFVAMLAVSGALELLLTLSPNLSNTTLELVGVLLTACTWGFGFGHISRSFEREADWFGATCVTPEAEGCALPCALHPSAPHTEGRRLCATAAAVFASALDRVALLNGIEHEEFSWRHSSIGSRMRFLTALAADPNRLRQFHAALRRIKAFLLVTAVGGGGYALYYCLYREPLLLRAGAG